MALLQQPLGFLERLRDEYGGVVGLLMGGERVVLVAGTPTAWVGLFVCLVKGELPGPMLSLACTCAQIQVAGVLGAGVPRRYQAGGEVLATQGCSPRGLGCVFGLLQSS